MEEGGHLFVRVRITGGTYAGRKGVIEGTFTRAWVEEVQRDDLGDQIVVYARYDPSAKSPFLNWIDRVPVRYLKVL